MIKSSTVNLWALRINLGALVFWILVASCVSVYGVYTWNPDVFAGAGVAWLWAHTLVNRYSISKMQNAQPTVTITFREKSDDNDQK